MYNYAIVKVTNTLLYSITFNSRFYLSRYVRFPAEQLEDRMSLIWIVYEELFGLCFI